jgi:hypothetical protein
MDSVGPGRNFKELRGGVESLWGASKLWAPAPLPVLPEFAWAVCRVKLNFWHDDVGVRSFHFLRKKADILRMYFVA